MRKIGKEKTGGMTGAMMAGGFSLYLIGFMGMP